MQVSNKNTEMEVPNIRFMDDQDPQNEHSHRNDSNIFQSAENCELNENFDDDELPKILTDMFEIFYCHLCCAKMNSHKMSDDHYNGKNHLKKVKTFMFQFFTENGLPIPKKFLPEHSNMSCNVCKIDFNSEENVVSHYHGFGHRVELAKLENELSVLKISEENPLKLNDLEFTCDLCFVRANTKQQLQNHLLGKKHKHNEKKYSKLKLCAGDMKMKVKIDTSINTAKTASSPSADTDDNKPITDISLKKEKDNDKTSECCYDKDLTEAKSSKHPNSISSFKERQLKDMRSSTLDEEVLVECTICCIGNLTKAQLEKHVQSHEHKNEELLREKHLTFAFGDDTESRRIKCDFCNILLTPDLFEKHKKSKAHIKALKVVDENKAAILKTVKECTGSKVFICGACNVSMTDANVFSVHLECKNHRTKMAQQELLKCFSVGASEKDS